MGTPAVVQLTGDININPDDGNLEDVGEPQNSENERGPRYWQDCHQLLTLLPEEVWHHIGSFLQNQDILNLINSSLFFRDLFLKKRIFHLFLPVLEILIPKLENYIDTTTENYDKVVRDLLLNCRHSSKTWKRIIDKKACSSSPEKFSKTRNLVNYLLFKNYRFDNSSDVEKFLEHFHSSHPPFINPSPAKHIDLHIRLIGDDYLQLINRISTLLNKYGEHIWTFEMSIMFGNQNPVEFHQHFQEWLNYLPNLQTLTIFCFVPLRIINMEQVNLEALPIKLNSLRKFAVETFVPPLKNEDIPQWSWMERYNFSGIFNYCDNLNFLEITIFNKLDLNILESVRSPLKGLVVQFYCKEDELKLGEVFNLLTDRFSESLENLRVSFRVNNKPSGHMKVIRDSFNGRLNLMKVRKLEVTILKLYFLDFLLGMKGNLEELIINCAGLRSYEDSDFSEVERIEIGLMGDGQIIKFLGYQNKMLESNIWDLFPKLKGIILSGGDERREFKRENWRKI